MVNAESFEHINLKCDDCIALITLNRPDRLNAITWDMAKELHDVLDMVSKEFPATRAVIITGEGRGFCSGADVEDMASRLRGPEFGPINKATPGPSVTMQLAPHIRDIPQPVIAAVNGPAAGAGLGIALSCDIRVASSEARFASVFVKRSLVPDTGVSQIISSLAGPGIAAEMALTGNVYGSEWALSKGLVNEVVSSGELIDRARMIAKQIANNPPLAVKATKQLLNSNYPDLKRVIESEHSANDPINDTRDRLEAVNAFLEKREPKFTGA